MPRVFHRSDWSAGTIASRSLCFSMLAWLLPLLSGGGVLSADENELGGASPPRPYTRGNPPPVDRQYKRVGQWALKRVVEGEPEKAIEFLQQVLADRTDDSDARFVLAIAQGHAENVAEAEQSLKQALEHGLPPGRILAGPRNLMQPLRQTDTFRQVRREHRDRLVHGPMLGSMTARGVRIWVRTARPAEVTVLVCRDAEFESPTIGTVTPAESTRGRDFTAVVRVADLEPDTQYYYRVSVNGELDKAVHSFRTFPRRAGGAKFSIAFGGGAGWVPEHERMWNTIGSFSPHALLLLGDNVYSDDPETPEIQRYCYYRRQSRPEFRSLVATTPVFSIWDDHDFGTDDSWGGPDVAIPAWKPRVWNIFRQNWVNPSYGGGRQQPGVWYDFSIGDVDFIMLDGRYYRTDAGRFGGEGVENPTMLGPVQKQWLKERLSAAQGTFKVLVSPVPWDFRTKPGRSGLDTWRGYAWERDEIFSFLAEEGIEGVVLLSADRHRSDAWKIERPESYDLYEFNSSRLTNQHLHPTMDEAIFSYNEKQSFGLVEFDTTADDPSVTYNVVTIDGETVHTLTVKRSQLRNP
jgi:alkaline phosphatase D